MEAGDQKHKINKRKHLNKAQRNRALTGFVWILFGKGSLFSSMRFLFFNIQIRFRQSIGKKKTISNKDY